MKAAALHRSRTASLLLWSCITLFAVRVIGQFEALVVAPEWLPAMEAWYSGLMPYYLLLPAQVLLLMIMAVVAWNPRVRSGRFAAAGPRTARALRVFAYLYLATMVLRLGLNLGEHGEDFWRHGAIPVAFHWVLALFVLVSARSSEDAVRRLRLPAEYQHEDDEADDIPHGDVPPVPQPLADGPGFGEEIRYRHTG